MKKTILYTAVLLLISIAGCKKVDVPTWKAPSSIYFGFAIPVLNTSTDSIPVGFTFYPDSVKELVLKVPIAVLGLASKSDRPFLLKADPASTAIAGKHYDLPANPVIGAGKVTDTIAIVFHRTADLASASVTLILDLVPNDNFNTDFTTVEDNDGSGTVLSTTALKISLVDMLTEPTWWPDYYYGNYSKKKLLLMNQITGCPLDAFNSFDTVDYWIFWGTEFQRWLNDQKAAGNTILDEDGTPMAMDPSIG